jgi:hypothetical protein
MQHCCRQTTFLTPCDDSCAGGGASTSISGPVRVDPEEMDGGFHFFSRLDSSQMHAISGLLLSSSSQRS